MNVIESMLYEIGLSEYEAKSVMCLITHGTSTADEISKIARIPLPRVYDTIERLIRMGFVLSTKTRPKRYMILKPKVAFDHYIKHKKEECENKMNNMKSVCDKIVDDMPKLVPESKPPKGDDWSMWSTRYKHSVMSMRRNFQNNAQNSIIIFSGDASFIREDFDTLKKAIERGVKIKLLVGEPEESHEVRENIKTLQGMGIDMKIGYNGNMRGNIIDDNKLLVFLKSGKTNKRGLPGREKNLHFEMMITDNSLLLNTVKEYFDFHWGSL
jgi:sugar-specific transcriptional regulator TrmB